MKKNKSHELIKRLLFTLLILAVYLAGRSLLLYNVDPAAYQLEELDSENILVSMISGDRFQYTIFALGVMPYITVNLLMWVFMAVRGSEFRNRFSPQKTERLTLVLMILLSLMFAASRAKGLVFKESNLSHDILIVIAALEMTVGAFIVYKMVDFNKEYGIGAQMPIIIINILDNLVSTIKKFTWEELAGPLVLCLIMAVVMLFMENKMLRMPVQRVSIHNSYADKSYIAFKLNPIGVMPVMFAVTFFMLLKLIMELLLFLNKNSDTVQLIYEEMDLQNMVGIVAYLGIIFILDVVFSFIMLSPGEMAEQLQKGGDSIVGVYAGKKTKRYLRKKVLVLSAFSGCVLCLLMGISMGLSLKGEILPELALFPSTGMILTGILCSLYREVKTYWRFDSYSFFI